MESGTLEVTEWSNYALAVRFRAAAMGVPYLPVRSMLGTDTYKCSGAAIVKCPYTGLDLVALPALYPDIAAVHVHEADVYGNCRIRGTTVADHDVARAAKKLIVTCERLISHDEIRSQPDRTAIPYYCVDAVCEEPYGSYPGNMPYEDFSDEEHLKRWLTVEADPKEHLAFLDEMIFSVPDFDTYLTRCGGLKRMQQLRRQELLL
jgi:glutaconate CoA-transferase subunit A